MIFSYPENKPPTMTNKFFDTWTAPLLETMQGDLRITISEPESRSYCLFRCRHLNEKVANILFCILYPQQKDVVTTRGE